MDSPQEVADRIICHEGKTDRTVSIVFDLVILSCGGHRYVRTALNF